MGNFLTLDFWFNSRPGVFLDSSLKYILSFIILLFVLAIISAVIKRRWAKSLYAGFWKSLNSFFITNAAIGLILTFFNYEMVPFLSARFWLLLWAAGILVWLYFIARMFTKIPQKKALLEKEKEFKKYVP